MNDLLNEVFEQSEKNLSERIVKTFYEFGINSPRAKRVLLLALEDIEQDIELGNVISKLIKHEENENDLD